jgi:hypothetical protein
MALNPLLHPLDRHLEGLSLRDMKQETSVVAYADCVIIILPDKRDILKVTEIIMLYKVTEIIMLYKVTEIIMLYKSATSALIKVNRTTALP